jgi:hypothetical protein
MMPEFTLMLRDTGEMFAKLGPAEIQATIARYTAWFDRLAKTGKLKGSHKLRDRAGRVVRRTGSQVMVTDGPFAEGKEVLGGLFIIDAPSYEEAVATVNDCPHLDFGSIEVREIEIMRK